MTAIDPAVTRPSAGTLRPFATITATEAKLYSRDLTAVFFALVFPSLLLVVLGLLIPGFDDPIAGAGGLRMVDLYLPTVIAMAIGTVALIILPAYFAAYRETGVLRRLATTPVPPMLLLVSQLVLNLVLLALGVALAVLAGLVAFSSRMPERPGLVLGVVVLGAACCFGVGLLVAAVARTGRQASSIGTLVYFPMLVLAGVWLPVDQMPAWLQRASDFSPLGAASQALADAWFGREVSPLHLVVMVGYVAIATPVAARVFRWT